MVQAHDDKGDARTGRGRVTYCRRRSVGKGVRKEMIQFIRGAAIVDDDDDRQRLCCSSADVDVVF